eukprot:1866940-Amphidinium_carterae.1
MPEWAAKYYDKIHHISWNHECKYTRQDAYHTLTALVPHKKKWQENPDGPKKGKRKRRKSKKKAASEDGSDL